MVQRNDWKGRMPRDRLSGVCEVQRKTGRMRHGPKAINVRLAEVHILIGNNQPDLGLQTFRIADIDRR